MNRISFLAFLFALTAFSNASAVTIETSAGYRYEVETGGAPSPYLAFITRFAPTQVGPIKYEFKELKYKTNIPFSQRKAIRDEAIEIVDKYRKATGEDLSQQIREGMKDGRLITILLWVGSGKTVTEVRSKKDEEVLEKRITPYYYVGLMNPAGGEFEPFVERLGEYWLRGNTEATHLPFLNDEPGPDIKPYLEEILGVRGTPLWIAFRITKMQKESVDLDMEIFDAENIVRREKIAGSIRTNWQDQGTIRSYSVQPSTGNSVICFTTTGGTIEYDVKKLTFTSAPSKCK